MTSPSDRTVRFNLRLSPDEMAACEDAQERMGGAATVSMNTAIAALITEAYYYRAAAIGQLLLPVSPAALDAIRWTADELGIKVAEALEVLALRGLPHTPSVTCDHKSPGQPAPTPPVQMRPSGAPLPSPPPRDVAQRRPLPDVPTYARPRPAGLPPVQAVPGQTTILEGTPDDDR